MVSSSVKTSDETGVRLEFLFVELHLLLSSHLNDVFTVDVARSKAAVYTCLC